MEPILLLIARASLALVLGAAGAAKLADRDGSRQAMLGFGVPAALAPGLALLLPLAEIALGLALLPAASARGAAAGAFVLFLLFIAGIIWNLARGRRPDCHCFGQLSSRPIGPGTAVRNGLLLAVAALVAARPAPGWSSAGAPWLRPLPGGDLLGLAGDLLLLLLVAGEGWLLLHVLRQNGRLLLRVDALEARLGGDTVRAAALPDSQPAAPPRGLPVGTPAPEFDVRSLEGFAVTLSALRAPGLPLLLVSADPGCGPCTALLPDLAQWQRAHRDRLTIAVLTRGPVAANRRKFAPLGIERVLLQEGEEVTARYHAIGTPSAVLVDREGKIAAPVAGGAGEIGRLVEHAVRSSPPISRGPAAGDPAPAVQLMDLNGAPFDLAGRLGEPTVLLFWNPGCGFCRRMLDDLRAWEAGGEGEDGGLVLVATGGAEANRGQALRSAVLLDDSSGVARAYGASGTPSAVQVAPDGTIAGPLVVGAGAIMQLLRVTAPAPRPTH